MNSLNNYLIISILVLMTGLTYQLSKLERSVVYDCRNISYPTAIDVPQEVIKKCREKASDK